MGELKEPIKFGTKEWAPYNFNFINGCSNDCVYCYAKDMAIRFKRKNANSWKEEEPVSLQNKSFTKRDGLIMIPSSHDITPHNIDTAVFIISKLLDSGNELLIVTKPHFLCVKRLIDTFLKTKNLIRFRFTIGSSENEVLKLWEPGAPDFEERIKSLEYAFKHGFSTSISCEPLLDENFDELYRKVEEYVNGSIWVGKMNMATKRVRDNTNGIFPQKKVDDLLASQTDEKIITLYNKHKYDDRIKWKESIIKVVSQHHLI